MSKIYTINYKEKAGENLNRNLVRKRYTRAINEAIRNNKDASVFLLEVPAENYLEANLTSVKSLLKNGFEGVYLSFQRPFKNISALFEQNGIDVNKLLIIDGATMTTQETDDSISTCIQLPRGLEVEDMVDTICSSIPKLKSSQRFVFVDSLTTMSLYEPSSKALRLPEYLIKKMKKNGIENVVLIFNVAEGLAKKQYIENISMYADEHIHLGLCT